MNSTKRGWRVECRQKMRVRKKMRSSRRRSRGERKCEAEGMGLLHARRGYRAHSVHGLVTSPVAHVLGWRVLQMLAKRHVVDEDMSRSHNSCWKVYRQ